MQAKLITTFTPFGESSFLAKAGTIVNALRNNRNFPEPWIAQVGTFAALEAEFTVYQHAFQAAANRDRARIAERNDARAALTDRLRKLAPYLEVVADGDTTKLMTTGYDLRRDIVRGTDTTPLPAPAGFTAKHGTLSGQVILHAGSLPTAASYEAGYTAGDPHDGAVWTDAGSYAGCNKIELQGLTPGQRYWFRLRALNSNGPGAWTDPAGLMVV